MRCQYSYLEFTMNPDVTAKASNKQWFFLQYSVFVNFVAKVLYCLKKNKKLCVFLDSTVFLLIFLQKCCTVPKKPILFCKSAVLSQKKPKKQFFQVLGPRSAICLSMELVFLRQYSTFTKKDWFCWDSTVFLLIFLQKCCTVPKNQKKQSFPVLLPCEVPGPEKIVFFGFFGTVQHFSKKN